MISGYFKLVTLSEEVKAQNKIKLGAKIIRLDCKEYAGNYTGLESAKNKKGMLFFNVTKSKEIVKAHSNRKAEYCLTGSKNGCSINYGSIYKSVEFPVFAYSYPNSNPTIGKDSHPNPLYTFRNDLYLMIVAPDYSQIELLIVEDGKNHFEHHFQNLIDGLYDEVIERLKKEVKPMYEYIGLAKF
jgi:hypothetical protein